MRYYKSITDISPTIERLYRVHPDGHVQKFSDFGEWQDMLRQRPLAEGMFVEVGTEEAEKYVAANRMDYHKWFEAETRQIELDSM